jgi:hypothetical protein
MGTSNLRKVNLEVDKIEGTEFPPQSISFEGNNITLEGIYAEAGINLKIHYDEESIPNLGGDVYSVAELHSLMQSNRNPVINENESNMMAYMVIVTKYEEDGVLGIMFDSPKRGGCAVFYDHDFIRSDERAFIRTVCHELGHEFNLHHEDGITISENGSTKFTIMNQTWKIQPWPAAIGFKFGDHESLHLSNHPLVNVKPGGSAFYDCNTEHASWGH